MGSREDIHSSQSDVHIRETAGVYGVYVCVYCNILGIDIIAWVKESIKNFITEWTPTIIQPPSHSFDDHIEESDTHG